VSGSIAYQLFEQLPSRMAAAAAHSGATAEWWRRMDYSTLEY
jgi:hypothetical protein